MMQASTRAGQPSVDPLIEFERQLLKILAKFQEVHTMSIGNEEINRFMMQEIREHEHMVIFMNKLSEANNHMKPQQKKEYIKIYGKASQIFEEALMPYLQKMLNILLKKSKEGQTDLYPVISDTLGMITFHIVTKAEDYESQNDLLQQVLKVPYNLLTKTSNKNVQSAGAQCLSKVIQNVRNDLLWDNLDAVMDKIITIFKSSAFRGQAALLESLITIVFYLEEEFTPFVDRFIPVLIEQIQSSDWNTQKVGIDAINALTTTVPDPIIPHRVVILKALKPTRVHKMKPVREATQWTIKLLKESQPPLESHELAVLDDHPPKQNTQRGGIRGDRAEKSPNRAASTMGPSEQTTLKPYILADGGGRGGSGAGFARTSSRQGGADRLGISENRKSSAQLPMVRGNQHKMDVECLIPGDRRESTGEGQQPMIDLSSQVQPGGKKVSAATLKRRAKELEQAQKKANDDRKSQLDGDKSRERKPLFKRTPNSNFMKQQGAPDNIEVIVPKKGKPPLQQQYQSQKEGHGDGSIDGSQSMTRKTKAQRKFEHEMRQSARNATEEPENSDMDGKVKDQEVSPRREKSKPQARRKYVRKEDEDSCDIKIYEPPKREVAAKKSKQFNNDQLRVKDLVEDEDDVLGEDDEDENVVQHKQSRQRLGREQLDNSDLEDDQQQSPIRHRMDDSPEGMHEEASESDHIEWPTHKQQASEDDEAIAWPTKAASTKVTFGKNQKSSLKQHSEDSHNNNDGAKNRGGRRQRQPHRYNQTEELAAVMNFMSEGEQVAAPAEVKKRENRLSKYSTYDVDNQHEATEAAYNDEEDQRDLAYTARQPQHQPNYDVFTGAASQARGTENRKTLQTYQDISETNDTRNDTRFVTQETNYQNNFVEFKQPPLTPTGQQRAMNERARWMKGYGAGSGAPNQPGQIFNTTQDVNQMLLGRSKAVTNNFMPGSSTLNEAGSLQQTATAFDQYAYQSLSESLQVALNQINQLNTTVKGMHDQINRVQTEKNQLAQKVASLEQIVIQLSMFQTQRSNQNSMYHEQSSRNINNSQFGGGGTGLTLATNMTAPLQVPQSQSQFGNKDRSMEKNRPQHMASQQYLFDASAGQVMNGYSPQMNDMVDPQQHSSVGMVNQFSVAPQEQPQHHQSSQLNQAMKLMMQANSAASTVQPQARRDSQMKHIDPYTQVPSIFGAGGTSPDKMQHAFGNQQPAGMVGNDENKKHGLQWPVVENLLQKQMFDEAFMMILRQVQLTQTKGADLNNDSMMLIKALGKVGSFIVNQISEPVKCALFKQLFDILSSNEFIDFILSFLQEAISNYPAMVSHSLCQTVSSQLAQLREQDLTRSLQSSQGSKMTMQQRETMESLVKKYRANQERMQGNGQSMNSGRSGQNGVPQSNNNSSFGGGGGGAQNGNNGQGNGQSQVVGNSGMVGGMINGD